MTNSIKKNKGFLKGLFKKMAFFGVILLFIASIFLVYVNVKKNEISKDLLLKINAEFKGDFSVNKVSLGSLFSYPNIDVNVSDLYFYAPDNGLTKGQKVIYVPTAKFRANFSKIMAYEFIIDDLNISNAALYIERDSLKNMVISEAFSEYLEGEIEPNEAFDAAIKTHNEKEFNSKNNSISKELTEIDSTGLKITIKKLDIKTSEVIITDALTEFSVPISIKHGKGNFTYKNDLINGFVNIALNPLKGESLLETDYPINVKANYKINLESEVVNVTSKELLLGNYGYNLDYNYNYSDKSFMSLELVSNKQGVSLNSLFLDEDQEEGDMDLVEKGGVDEESKEDSENIGLYGVGHFKAKMTWNPSSKLSFIEALNASFSLQGRDLNIEGMDLDNLINKFKKSQNFNFTDIGAVLFAGPAGIAITKGGDFVNLAFTSKGKSTRVKHFNAEWVMQKGMLKTNDVALSTTNNLINSDGSYNLKNNYIDFKFNIIDKDGCTLVSQQVWGEKDSLQYGKVKILKALLGPVKSFFRDIGFVKCDTIYGGIVKHPTLNKKHQ